MSGARALCVALLVVGGCRSNAPSPSSGASVVPSADDEEPADETPSSHAGGAASGHRQGPPCQSDLASCPASGCETPGTPHALFDQRKKRTTAADGSPVTFASARPIDFGTLRFLQGRATSLVGEETMLDAAQRQLLAAVATPGGTFGEGAPVRLKGYLARHDPHRPGSGVHAGGIESVNCRLREERWRDFHVPLVPGPGDDECDGVVVEMIPQGREQHPAWTIEGLRSLQRQGRAVLVVGPLLYDSEHATNADCAHLHRGQPKRMSLWEVHPVVEMYVCREGAACDAGRREDWDLE
ncbi:MAG TPA: hypothetical protein VIF15_18945 [Polyangiaceae bacterium]